MIDYEILGESVKSAISLKLGEIFGNDTIRYKENITNPRYPSFWIIQVNLTQNLAGLQGSRLIANQTRINRRQLDYLINIQYRHAENVETVSNLQQKLDEIGLKLNTQFNEINLGLPVKVYNKNYEKVDGVGQFTFNVTVYANITENTKQSMDSLEIQNEIKEEN